MDRRYVGIDLHRRRSVIYAMGSDGVRLFCERIANEPLRLLEVVSTAGEGAEVVIEATYGWYWAVDLLQDAGFNVHLAHPSGNDWGNRRVKNDERDARDLADLLRLGRLAEAWSCRTRRVGPRTLDGSDSGTICPDLCTPPWGRSRLAHRSGRSQASPERVPVESTKRLRIAHPFARSSRTV